MYPQHTTVIQNGAVDGVYGKGCWRVRRGNCGALSLQLAGEGVSRVGVESECVGAQLMLYSELTWMSGRAPVDDL